MATREIDCSSVEEATKNARSATVNDTEEDMQNIHGDNEERESTTEVCLPRVEFVSVESDAAEEVEKDACLGSKNGKASPESQIRQEPHSTQSDETLEGSTNSMKVDCECPEDEERLYKDKTCHSVVLDILPDSTSLNEQVLKSPDICYIEMDTSDDEQDMDVCRICHCGNEGEPLISPCLCTGSVKFVHHSCLMSWLQRAVISNCELCLYSLAVQRKRKPLNKWRLPNEKPIPLIWLMAFVIAMTLNISSLANDGTQRCTSKPCIVFYVLGSAGALLGMAFFYHWSKKSATYLKKWIAWNEEWRLVGPTDLPAKIGNQNLAFSTKSLSGNERNEDQAQDIKVGENSTSQTEHNQAEAPHEVEVGGSLSCVVELSALSETEVNQAQVT